MVRVLVYHRTYGRNLLLAGRGKRHFGKRTAFESGGNADSDAHAHAKPHADADADTDAHAYADTNAYSNPDHGGSERHVRGHFGR